MLVTKKQYFVRLSVTVSFLTSITLNCNEDLKLKIQNDMVVQQDLRSTFETQSAIEQLKGRCQTEFEDLKEKISDYKFQLEGYRIASNSADLPGSDVDIRGEELKRAVQSLSEKINDQLADRERVLTKNQDSLRNTPCTWHMKIYQP